MIRKKQLGNTVPRAGKRLKKVYRNGFHISLKEEDGVIGKKIRGIHSALHGRGRFFRLSYRIRRQSPSGVLLLNCSKLGLRIILYSSYDMIRKIPLTAFPGEKYFYA